MREINFEYVIERLKRAARLKTDGQVANALGMSPSAFANRKHSGSLPFDLVLKFGISQNLDLNALFTGEGELKKTENGPVDSLADMLNVQEVDPKLMGAIFLLLEKENPEQGEGTEEIKGRHAGMHGALAALIYNKVFAIKDPKVRLMAVRAEVSEFMRIGRFYQNEKLEDFGIADSPDDSG